MNRAGSPTLSVDLVADLQAFEASLRQGDMAFGRAASKMEQQARKLDGALTKVGTGFGDNIKFRALADNVNRLEAELDPTVAALRRYEAVQRSVAAAVEAGAVEQAQANRVLDLAQQRYAAQTASLQRVGGGMRSFGTVAQQAGFQVGDFATQVAGGTNPLIALTQQGTQFVSMLGPWGAVVGAAGAVVGALAVSFLNASDAAEDLELNLSGLTSGMSELESLARAYADAIRDTAAAQSAATRGIIANTREEFEAKQQLLALQREEQVIIQEGRLNQLAAAEDEVARLREVEARYERMSSQQQRRRGGALEVQLDDLPDADRTARRLAAEAKIAEIQIEAAQRALDMTFDEAVSEAGISASGGGGRATTERLVEMYEALEQQRRALLLSERDAVRYRAAMDAVEAAGGANTAQTREMAEMYADLAVEIYDAEQAMSTAADATREAARASEQAREGQERFSKSLSSTIVQAESLEDALRKVLVKLIEVGVEGAVYGSGPFGAQLSGAIGGSVWSRLFAGSASGFNPQLYSQGGIVTRPTLFPRIGGAGLMGEAGPEAILPLRRGADGRLGVASTGGGGSVSVNVHVDAQGAGPREVDVLRGEIRALEQTLPLRVEGAVKRAQAYGRL